MYKENEWILKGVTLVHLSLKSSFSRNGISWIQGPQQAMGALSTIRIMSSMHRVDPTVPPELHAHVFSPTNDP